MQLECLVCALSVLALSLAACSDGDEKFASVKLCQKTCSQVDECCPTPPCDTGMTAQKCEGGTCRLVGCTGGTDCALIPKARCFQVTAGSVTYGSCAIPCAQDSECALLQLKCLAAGYCGKQSSGTTSGCKTDAECAAVPGHNTCDPSSGSCICEEDQTCQSALGVAGGTYTCVGL